MAVDPFHTLNTLPPSELRPLLPVQPVAGLHVVPRIREVRRELPKRAWLMGPDVLVDFGRGDVRDEPANRQRREQLVRSLPGRFDVGVLELTPDEKIEARARFQRRFAASVAAVMGLGALIVVAVTR